MPGHCVRYRLWRRPLGWIFRLAAARLLGEGGGRPCSTFAAPGGRPPLAAAGWATPRSTSRQSPRAAFRGRPHRPRRRSDRRRSDEWGAGRAGGAICSTRLLGDRHLPPPSDVLYRRPRAVARSPTKRARARRWLKPGGSLVCAVCAGSGPTRRGGAADFYHATIMPSPNSASSSGRKRVAQDGC